MHPLAARLRRRVRRSPRIHRAFAKIDAIVRYWPQVRTRPADAWRFVFFDREFDNYTYEIGNTAEMVVFLATALGAPAADVAAAVDELENDRDLREALNAGLRSRPDRRHTALYARRAGWYALARVTRPRRVVEIGVHDGLGSSVLLRALERNGGEGRLTGIDIDPSAGWLVPLWLRERYELLVEDSATAMPRIAREQAIDLLIVDGDHRHAQELADYFAASPGLTDRAIMVSDTARFGRALVEFATATGRQFAFWAESPVHHFFVGEGIGLALPNAPGTRASSA